jgi:hypothetical protein
VQQDAEKMPWYRSVLLLHLLLHLVLHSSGSHELFSDWSGNGLGFGEIVNNGPDLWLVTSTHHFAGPNRLEDNTQLMYINSRSHLGY